MNCIIDQQLNYINQQPWAHEFYIAYLNSNNKFEDFIIEEFTSVINSFDWDKSSEKFDELGTWHEEVMNAVPTNNSQQNDYLEEQIKKIVPKSKYPEYYI